MSELLNTVNKRTKLIGQNRLELLIFDFGTQEKFGINVFKVKEVVNVPSNLSRLPQQSNTTKGMAHIHDMTVPIIDLAVCANISDRPEDGKLVILTEFNRSVQGFLVNNVIDIINLDWKEVLPPPPISAKSSMLTAIATYENQIIQILDVEKILADLSSTSTDVTITKNLQTKFKRVLVVDDSSTARKQVKAVLTQLGLEAVFAEDGQKALDMFKLWYGTGLIPVDLIISDIEMPEMDGFTLTKNVRELSQIPILLHSSLNMHSNIEQLKKVGASGFISKYDPNDLARAIAELNV